MTICSKKCSKSSKIEERAENNEGKDSTDCDDVDLPDNYGNPDTSTSNFDVHSS
jgi:hypothetical protein